MAVLCLLRQIRNMFWIKFMKCRKIPDFFVRRGFTDEIFGGKHLDFEYSYPN